MSNPFNVPPGVLDSEYWEFRVMHGNPDLADIFIGHYGPGMTHNMPCAICGENHAILEGHTGIMQPCGQCQSRGYKVIKRGKFRRWMDRHRI